MCNPESTVAAHSLVCPVSVIELWKATLEFQRHINDLQMRIRTIALTFLGVVISAAGLSATGKLTVKLFRGTHSLGFLILWMGIIAWLAFYFMDRWWYQRLLIGAVNHSEYIEKRWKHVLPEITLAKSIRRETPIKMVHSRRIEKIMFFCLRGIIDGEKIRSEDKVDLFYCSIEIALVILMVALSFVEN